MQNSPKMALGIDELDQQHGSIDPHSKKLCEAIIYLDHIKN